MRKILFLFLFLMVASFISYRVTHAYFIDTAVSENMTFSAAESFGEEESPSTQSVSIVINEVYYDVGLRTNGSNSESEPDNEWIELYNTTALSINVKDWEICDNNDCMTINPNVSVPSLGFALVSRDASTWTFWTIPSGIEKINSLGGTPPQLSNVGDRVILKDNAGEIVDQMSYGTDNTILNPSAAGVAEGHSLERSPTGFDTDSGSDFVDRETPTPGN